MPATPVPSPAPTATATPTPTPAPPATPTPVPPDAVAIHVADEAERSHLETELVEAGFVVADSFVGADGADGAERAIADTPLAGAHPFVLARWAAVTDQRRDVLDLGRDDVVRILRGDAGDWSEFGGSAQPIEVFLPVSQVARIADALGIPAGELAATALPYGALADHVAATPGAFALVEPERLRLGVLALTVDGHDPYRDPAEDSPLRLVRWLRAPTGEDALALAAAAGIAAAPSFDPAGVFVAGELIPVRCSNHVLAQLDDYGAMFDGTREALLAADIAVTSLDSSLTDLGTPTLCIRTYVLQGSPRVVDALSEAGIDVVLTVGNHIADCWGGCSPGGALLDTLTRLHDAGIATAGAGENLQAARTPAVVAVDTGEGPVRIAFLAYDSLGYWNAATEYVPGTAPLDAASILEDVRAALEVADHVVVGASWGNEYTADPTAFQRDMGPIAIDAGATFVLGSHPHWTQAVEHFDGALVAYSLGSFVFDQDWSVETTQGMVMELGFTAERLIGYRIRPVVIRGEGGELRWIYRPEFVDPAGEGRPILDRVWEAQDRLPAR